jgi:hypothetical protein
MNEIPTWQTISDTLRTRLAAYAGVELTEEIIAEVRAILHDVLSDVYVRDQSTGLYWLTGTQAGMIGQGNLAVSGDAVASFICEMAPLTELSKLRFTLRQVSPFTFEAQESSVSCDDSQSDDLPGRGPPGPDAVADPGSTGGHVHALGGPDETSSVGSASSLGAFPAGDAIVPPAVQHRRAPWSLLD